MDGQLLVRVYNVGLGDCIYLRVPDQNRAVHILIDCGNKFDRKDRLKAAIDQLKGELEEADSGKKRLDLLVVSHPHEDHHKGFEAEYFEGIEIRNLWLSPAFNRLNPNAQSFFALQDAALRLLDGLSAVALDELQEEVQELLSLRNEQAVEMLCTTMPQANGIEARYVSAGTPEEQLQIFEDPAIRLKVLAPMEEIDRYYFGGEGLPGTQSGFDSLGAVDGYGALFLDPGSSQVEQPRNISTQDFRRLRSRVHVNALALAEIAGHAVNNLSVVLLLEWRGRRLLFPGDAEWHAARGGEVQTGRANGSWNVMWQERRADLSQPLDFLKVGHHGSENATPWKGKADENDLPHPINAILDALLPLPEAGQTPAACAVVSTRRTPRWSSIPSPALMEELGRRVLNSRTEYLEDASRTHVKPGVRQPQRTDLEAQVTATPEVPVSWIELFFPPA